MSAIFDEVQAFFKYEDWPIQVVIPNRVLETQFRGDNGQWFCYAQVNQETSQFAFYSVCPTNTPPEKRVAMAEFVCRANYGLIIGNFELNFEDGQVRYKTSLDVETTEINFSLIKNMVYANVTLMNHYFTGLMRVIYSDKTPTQIVEEIEAKE